MPDKDRSVERLEDRPRMVSGWKMRMSFSVDSNLEPAAGRSFWSAGGVWTCQAWRLPEVV